MAKDYAAKKNRRKNATRFDDVNDGNNSFKTMLYSTVFGIVLALVAVYFYQTSNSNEPAVVKTETTKPKPSAKSRYQAVPAEEVETNEFEYHEELKKKRIEVDTPPPLPASEENENRYIMQCGSFRKISAAETLRAQIGMNGFEARIKTTNEKNGTWHRVQIGPYDSKRKAETDRRQLERNNINDCAIW